MSKEKPDGYVAWHESPSERRTVEMMNQNCGFCTLIHPSADDAIHEIKAEVGGDFDKDIGLDLIPWLRNRGWRIRPVKLVFLDKEQEK